MEEMTPRERIQAAIALQPVDRVPVIPMVDVFSARYQRLKLADVVRDADQGREAMIRTYDDFGGWDATYMPSQLVTEFGFALFGMAAKLPGFDLGEDELAG